MSRIHDALKRAEQERSMRDGIGMEVEVPTATPGTGPVPVIPASDTAPSRAAGPAASTSGPIAIDSVLADCPVLAWRPDTKTMLFFSAEGQATGAEEFRTLRSRLYQLREKHALRKILVTSSLPQEGKSFVAANLAQVGAAQPGCRVLLIDADLRNPSLHLSLGTSPTPGLSEYLLGETEEFGIMQRGSMENLFFIPSGRPVPGQTELVSNGRLKHLLDRVETLFDWIIIDSPASLPVSDSGLIANVCDGVLMVVRAEATSFDLVRKALRKLPEKRIVGVVLNGIPAETDQEIQRYYRVS